jgi:hypothetical protein
MSFDLCFAKEKMCFVLKHGKKMSSCVLPNCGTTRFIERLCKKEIGDMVFLMEILLNVYHVWFYFFWNISLLRRKKGHFTPHQLLTPLDQGHLWNFLSM